MAHVQLSIVAQDWKDKQDSSVWQDQTESPGLASPGPYSFRILPWYYVENR